MTKENVRRLLKELAEEYAGSTQLEEAAKTLVQIPNALLPDGCSPSCTTVLVVLDEVQPAPQLLLKALPTLPNGKAPRSVSTATFAGESWHAFSYNQFWNENSHTAVQFVEGRLRRFALSE